MSETKELKKRIQKYLRSVKTLLPRGLTKELMVRFDSSQGFISDIINGRKWSLEIGEHLLWKIDSSKKFDYKNYKPKIEWNENLKPREIKSLIRTEIKELKPLLKRGIPQEVARIFDVPESMVYDIMESRSWHLEVANDLLRRCKVNLARAQYLERELEKIISQKQKTTSI